MNKQTYIFSLLLLIISFGVNAQQKPIKNTLKEVKNRLKQIVRAYHSAHRRSSAYPHFKGYLQDKNLAVFDDQVYREVIPLEEYLSIFQKRSQDGFSSRILYGSMKIVETKILAGRILYTISFNREVSKKLSIISMVVQAERVGKNDLDNFRILRIINPEESKNRNENAPYIASISLAAASSQVNKLVAQNIGASKALPSIMMLGGSLSLSFGIKDLALLQTSRFTFSMSLGSMVSPTRTWDSIQQNNVTAVIPDNSLSITQGNYYSFGVNYQLYLYQSLLKSQDKRSWTTRRGNKFDGYFLTGYYWHNYTFKPDRDTNEYINDLSLVGGTFMLGGGMEFWLKSMRSSFFLEATISKGVVPNNDNLNFFPQSIFNIRLGARLNAVSHRTIIR